MAARESNASIAYTFLWLDGTVRAGGVATTLEVVGVKGVLKRAGVSETGGRHAEADVLSKETGCDIYRERSNILAYGLGRSVSTRNVRRVVHQTLPIKLRLTEIELAVATHAWPPPV